MVVKKPEAHLKGKNLKFIWNKSKSDLGNTGGFLSKVQDSVDSLPQRFSEAQKYSPNYIKINLKSETKSLKSEEMITAKCSMESRTNKEGSTNVENSIISNQMLKNKRYSDIPHCFKEVSVVSTPTFVEEINNPFSTPGRK